MKIKIAGLFAAIIFTFTGLVIYQVDKKTSQDREVVFSRLANEEINRVVSLLRFDIEDLKSKNINLSKLNLKNEKINWAAYDRFQGVALVDALNTGLNIQQAFFRDEITADPQSEAYLNQQMNEVLANLNPADLRDAPIYLTDIRDKSNRILLLSLQSIGGQFILSLVDEARWQQVLSGMKKSEYDLSVVNQKGRLLVHSTAEYAGAQIGNSPLFEEIKKQSSMPQGKLLKADKGYAIFGKYEPVEGTNLYVLFQTPDVNVMKGVESSVMRFGIVGLGGLFIGLALLLYFLNNEESQTQSGVIEKEAAAKTNLSPVAPMVRSIMVAGPVNNESTSLLQEQKLHAYKKIAQAFSLEMKTPVYSIMAHTQLLQDRISTPEEKKSVDYILKEVRKIKEMMDKVFKFSGEKNFSKEKNNLTAAIDSALKNLDLKIKQKNIHITRKQSAEFSFDFAKESIERAIEAILLNSMEALERMQNKEISISVSESEGNVILEIEDNGEGIEEANLNQIFDPFYTTRSYSNHIGLGLTMVQAVAADHGGTLSVESSRGKGAKVKVTLPMHLDEVNKLQLSKTENIVVPPLPGVPVLDIPKLDLKEVQLEDDPVKKALSQNLDEMLEFPNLDEQENNELNIITDEEKLDLGLSSPEGTIKVEHIEVSSLPQPILGDLQVKVVPPQFQANKKASELDEYTFEIRKPTKGI